LFVRYIFEFSPDLTYQNTGIDLILGLWPTRQQVRLLTSALLIGIRALTGVGGGGCERQNCLPKKRVKIRNGSRQNGLIELEKKSNRDAPGSPTLRVY
jgi:hypothetical protein